MKGVGAQIHALVALLGMVAGSCTVLLDTQQKQCETDQDCWSRGLKGATCVQELCQPPLAVADNPVMATVGADEMRETAQPEPSPASPAQGAPAQAATASPSDAGMLAMKASSVPASATLPPSAGAGGQVAAAAKAGASAACMGDACADCSVDADCEQTSMPGARCVDGACWPAMPQCSADKDCISLGPEYDGGRCLATQCQPNPRWRCAARTTVASTEQKKLSVLVRDSLSLNPVPMVRIVACQKLDLMCANPVTEATTDSSGMLSITLPASFAGYLQQTDRSDYAPAMYFLPPVFPEDGVLEPFPLLSSGAIIDALAASLGAGVDPKRGNLMLIAEDCFGMALSGVTFTSPQSDDKTVQFYVRDLLPSTSAKETADIGNGGYLNFPAGTAVINVDRAADKLHLATVSIVVRPGFISVAYMRPQAG